MKRLAILIFGLAAGVYLSLSLFNSDPELATSANEGSETVPDPSGLSPKRPPHNRTTVVPAVDDSHPKPIVEAEDKAVRIRDLPSKLKASVGNALRQCRHAHNKEGRKFPSQTPRITLKNAIEVSKREKDVVAAITEMHLYAHKVLERRVESHPNDTIKLSRTQFQNDFDKIMKERFEGWPDGYLFLQRQQGDSFQVGVWKIKGDSELEILEEEKSAMFLVYGRQQRLEHLRLFTFEDRQ